MIIFIISLLFPVDSQTRESFYGTHRKNPMACIQRMDLEKGCRGKGPNKDGWANGIHQKFIDTYFDTSYTVEEDKYLLKAS